MIVQVLTGEAATAGVLASGYAVQRATVSPTFGKPMASTVCEVPQPSRQKHSGRTSWRGRALKAALLATFVAFELAWLIVLGYAAHRLFLQSLLDY